MNNENITGGIADSLGGKQTPEEATLIMRLRIFFNFRWFAVVGIITATLLATCVFDIKFPVLPVYIICAVIAIYNITAIYLARNLDRLPTGSLVSRIRSLNIQNRTFDFIALAVLLHFTGGIENPFIFLFVLHIITASVPLPYRTVYIYATFAMLGLSLLVGLEYAGIIPHVHLQGFVSPDLYREPVYIAGLMIALVVTTYSSAYMATAIAGELRKRQREVNKLQEELLAERTMQLEAASVKITRLDEEKGRFLNFLSMATHDLKAPLTAIQGYLWLMIKGHAGDLNEKQKNILDRSSIRINELMVLINELLDIPRIEKGLLVAEMKEMSMGEVVRQVTEELRHQAIDRGLSLNVSIPDKLPPVNGSAARLKQVTTNILNNAISYTHSGEINVNVKEQDNCIRVEITDTGIGIPPADLPKLFEDFFRGSNVEVKGTGLGLSLSKRIIEAHGGKIWAESPAVNGRGSRFIFTVPVEDSSNIKTRSSSEGQSHC
jgi:signal transduction histidine kinase